MPSVNWLLKILHHTCLLSHVDAAVQIIFLSQEISVVTVLLDSALCEELFVLLSCFRDLHTNHSTCALHCRRATKQVSLHQRREVCSCSKWHTLVFQCSRSQCSRLIVWCTNADMGSVRQNIVLCCFALSRSDIFF